MCAPQFHLGFSTEGHAIYMEPVLGSFPRHTQINFLKKHAVPKIAEHLVTQLGAQTARIVELARHTLERGVEVRVVVEYNGGHDEPRSLMIPDFEVFP